MFWTGDVRRAQLIAVYSQPRHIRCSADAGASAGRAGATREVNLNSVFVSPDAKHGARESVRSRERATREQ